MDRRRPVQVVLEDYLDAVADNAADHWALEAKVLFGGGPLLEGPEGGVGVSPVE
ncbi:hypothetical protein [Arthrobacter globiformis]|jgi:hypothetical protein|uniref:hypothetical protein n=1 Tax=Arthrobacter globiformis TaxID=1665 RepID=UPI001C2F598D|nr:hypothetical protein [Arthrobacter globiformis]